MRTHNILTLVGALLLMAACSSQAYLKKGDSLYKTGRFNSAGKMYQKAYKKAKEDDDRANIAFKVAVSYDKVNVPIKASSWYRKALRSRDTFAQAVYCLAKSELKNNHLEDVEENFMEYQELKPDCEKSSKLMSSLDRIKEWAQNPTRYKVVLAKEFNSSASDFCASYMGRDTNVVLFSSTRAQKRKERVDGVTGDLYSNIYEAHYSNEIRKESKKKKGKIRIITSDKYRWSRPHKLGDTINSRYNEGGVSFSKKGDVMLFTSSKKLGDKSFGAKIYSAKKLENGWGDVMLIDLVADSLTCGHPSLAQDGNRLYFVSDMPGGLGGKDIWVAKKEGSGWSTPINMGKRINTPGDEMFPFIHEDGTLYFSSDTHPGMGGLDIFSARQDDLGRWRVENMGSPVNSTADDFGIVFQEGENKGMLTSSRRRGNDDIYRFEFQQMIFSYKGIVRNQDDNTPLKDVDIQVISSQGDQQEIKSDQRGSFAVSMEPNTEYIIVASSKGFLNGKDQVSTVELDDSKEFSGVITLKPIEKPIELPNIFYDFARWELRDESKNALDELVGTLNDNPNITIELGSHTDMVGGAAPNQELSQKRAQSVVDYLIDKGIYWDRLKAKGYGESHPKVVDQALAKEYAFLSVGDVLDEVFIKGLSSVQQQDANQINRRTDFRVLATNYKPGPLSSRRPGEGVSMKGQTIVKDIDKVKGVFYSVQIGVYKKGKLPRLIEQFKVVFTEKLNNGDLRYTTGIFDSYDEAKIMAQKISHKGIKAFVVAYNNGKKITFEQAKKLKH